MEPAIDVDQVIRDLGGPAKVAELCGIGTVQAVSMWLVRKKIPPARLMYLKAVRPDVFKAAQADTDSTETPPPAPEDANDVRALACANQPDQRTGKVDRRRPAKPAQGKLDFDSPVQGALDLEWGEPVQDMGEEG